MMPTNYWNADKYRKHVVMMSGGIGSWAAAKRVAEKHGTDDLVMLFADTMMEDEDLYRFIHEAAINIGGELVIIKDGRTPWEAFKSARFIGNSRIDPCSKLLKRDVLNKWRDDNCDPNHTTIYIGIDWTESHRFQRMLNYVGEWDYQAPMLEAPFITKSEMLEMLDAEGIKRPRLYEMGFAHNNCGGFCCKAGHSHFRLLLRTMPERFAWHEEQERILRAQGINGTILTSRVNGTKKLLTLEEFRLREENSPELFEEDDLAKGCGCALPT